LGGLGGGGNPGQTGTDGLGGGGGGATTSGADGGSGIVILRYVGSVSNPFIISDDDLAPYQVGEYVVHEFTYASTGGDGIGQLTITSVIPEPASLALVGLAGLLTATRRRK